MNLEVLWATPPCYLLSSKKHFSKCIDQLLEDEKDFGGTPGQDKSKAKKKAQPKEVWQPKRLLLAGNNVVALNYGGDDDVSSNMTDLDVSDSDDKSYL